MAGIRYNVNLLKGFSANALFLRWAFLIFLAAWFLVNLLTLSWYPALTISPDEAWIADVGLGFLRSGIVKTTMFPGTTLNDVGYGILSFPVYAGALALCFKAFGINPFSARLISLLGGILIIISVYLIGRRLWSEKTGILAGILIALSGAFVMLCHVIRPEPLLVGFSGMAFYTALRERDGRGWAIACGFLTGLLPSVYVMGSLISLAILTYLLLRKAWKSLPWFLIGLLIPAAFFIFYNIIPHLGHLPRSDVQSGYTEGFIPILLFREPFYALHLYLQNLVFRNLHCIIGPAADNRTFYFVSSIAGAIAILFSAYYWIREQRPLVILFLSGLVWIALFPRGLAPPHNLASFAMLFYPLIFPLFAGALMESFWNG
ncbi:MAG: ArnT family glycosyltransferase, partial [Candidatus Hydrothermia bacterium]